MWGGGIPVVRDEGHDPATGDLVMALARRVRRAHVEALADWEVTPAQARALRVLGRCRRDAPLGPRRGAAHRPAVGHGGGRRAGGPGLGAPRARPHRPPGHPPGARPMTAGGWWRGSTTYGGRRRSGSSTCSRRPSVVRSTRSWPSSWGRTCDRSCRPDRGHRLRQEHRVGGPRRARGRRHRRRPHRPRGRREGDARAGGGGRGVRSRPAHARRRPRPGRHGRPRLRRPRRPPAARGDHPPAGPPAQRRARGGSTRARGRRPRHPAAGRGRAGRVLRRGRRGRRPRRAAGAADGRGPGLDPRGRRVPHRRAGDPRGTARDRHPRRRQHRVARPTCAGRSRRSTRSSRGGPDVSGSRGSGG